MIPADPRTDEPDPHEEAVAAWLTAQRPAPSPELRARGRALVRRATYERHLRHRAAVLLATGWVAVAAGVVVALLG